MSVTLKFRLNHVCYRKGCEGVPGDVIDVTRDDADWLLTAGGGELLDKHEVARPESSKGVDFTSAADPVGTESQPSDEPPNAKRRRS